MNLSLIGYRGAGKSAVGRIVADRAGLILVNLDAEIIARASLPVPEIVARFGWDRFRDLESEALAAAVRGDGRLLDCGGGVILREPNRRLLKAAGPVVWLTARLETILARIRDDTQRPSLTGRDFRDEVREVLAAREPLYRACADHIIATDGLAPAEVAEAVLQKTGIRNG